MTATNSLDIMWFRNADITNWFRSAIVMVLNLICQYCMMQDWKSQNSKIKEILLNHMKNNYQNTSKWVNRGAKNIYPCEGTGYMQVHIRGTYEWSFTYWSLSPRDGCVHGVSSTNPAWSDGGWIGGGDHAGHGYLPVCGLVKGDKTLMLLIFIHVLLDSTKECK